jgi:hypothetical protein
LIFGLWADAIMSTGPTLDFPPMSRTIQWSAPCPFPARGVLAKTMGMWRIDDPAEFERRLQEAVAPDRADHRVLGLGGHAELDQLTADTEGSVLGQQGAMV